MSIVYVKCSFASVYYRKNTIVALTYFVRSHLMTTMESLDLSTKEMSTGSLW